MRLVTTEMKKVAIAAVALGGAIGLALLLR